MPASGTMVIFIEFPIWRWCFNPVLNASVMSTSAAMRVYIFHDCLFQVPVMSPFFRPHQSYSEVTFDDIYPYFQSPRYPTDGKSNLDTRLTPTVSLYFDPLEPSYLSCHVESDPSEPSYPLVIHLTSYSSSSSAAPHHAPAPVRGRGFIHTRAVPLWMWACSRRRI